MLCRVGEPPWTAAACSGTAALWRAGVVVGGLVMSAAPRRIGDLHSRAERHTVTSWGEHTPTIMPKVGAECAVAAGKDW